MISGGVQTLNSKKKKILNTCLYAAKLFWTDKKRNLNHTTPFKSLCSVKSCF